MTDPVVLRRDRDVLAVRGPDAEAYLQGQLSQDVVALAEGDSAWTFVLQPAGKVDAWLRITCRSAGHFLLDVDGGYGGALLDRLRRFLLRTDCTVEPLDWQAATLWGTTEGEAPAGGVAIPLDWEGVEALDLLGPEVAREAATDDWEPLRLAAGIPAMGSEIDGDTIPGATGLVGRSASFTKGCYTGQELVARVDSRAAGTPTHLVRVRGEGARPAAGDAISAGGDEIGHLTSVATLGDGFVALGWRRRAAADVDVAEVEGPAGPVAVHLTPV
ncbi:MAG: hypothetical protein QF575_09390 [Acidimicrobiales bacterium]|nr:hypothetical protein [Acidimicrobiales bacterium]